MPTAKYQTMNGVDALDTEYLLGADTLPRIPRGDVTLLFGDGAIGKGRVIIWAVKQVTAAGGSVVVILPEDHPNEQVRPRLEAAGLTEAEMGRVINLTRLPGSGRFKISADTTHDGDLPLLREEILPDLARKGHDVRMIVLDPLSAVIGWGSIQSNAGARRAVEPIQDLCLDTGIAAVIVAHTVKSGALQGSAGLLQCVRLCYRISRDRNNPAVRVISAEKANNLPPTEDLRFEIQDDDNGNASVVFLTADEIDRRQRQWRKPSYTAAVSIQRPGADSREIRQVGTGFTSLREAQYACSGDEAAPGGFVSDWTHHDARTVVASIQRNDGTVVSFAIARKGGPEVIDGGTVKAAPQAKGA